MSAVRLADAERLRAVPRGAPSGLSPLDTAQRVAESIRDLRADDDLEATIGQLVRDTLVVVPGCGAATIAVVANHRGRLDAYATTEPALEHLDRLQVELGEGPGLDATEQQPVVEVVDLAHDPRWSRWRGAAVNGVGVGSLRCLALTAAGRSYGTLTLYGLDDPLPQADPVGTQLWAAHVASAVAAAHARAGLQVAVESRTVIGVAIGMLMVQYGLDRDRAIDVLKRTSQASNVKLVDVAETYVDTRTFPAQGVPVHDQQQIPSTELPHTHTR